MVFLPDQAKSRPDRTSIWDACGYNLAYESTYFLRWGNCASTNEQKSTLQSTKQKQYALHPNISMTLRETMVTICEYDVALSIIAGTRYTYCGPSSFPVALL